MPALIRSQALCVVDAMRVEWHTRFWSKNVAVTAAAARNLSFPLEVGGHAMVAITDATRRLIRELLPASDCRTKLLEADDETYMHDGKAWPEAGVLKCNRSV